MICNQNWGNQTVQKAISHYSNINTWGFNAGLQGSNKDDNFPPCFHSTILLLKLWVTD